MSEIKKVTFRLRKSNFPIFPVQMGKLSLFQHETFRHARQLHYKQLHFVFILSLGFLLLIADWDYNLSYLGVTDSVRNNDRCSLLRTGIVTQQARMAFCLVYLAADQITILKVRVQPSVIGD